MTLVYISLALAGTWMLWWWCIGRNVPKYPPLAIANDDAAMLSAIEAAKSSIARFRDLYAADHNEAQVKVPFITSSGETEHLWAEVLSLKGEVVSVRYLTPPVSHTGTLERLHDHSLSDVEDWVVIDKQNCIFGGFTQRVVFARAREVWGKLPPELEEQEKRYVS